MKLNNKLKLSLITIATIVSANVNAQTFYQCLPCPAGTYADGGKCTPCPAGTYSQVAGATSSAVCTSCPDYHWSNPGAVKCGRIQIPAHYFICNDTNVYVKKNLLAGENYLITNSLFGTNIGERQLKCVGLGEHHMTYRTEHTEMFLDCKKLPCDLPMGIGIRLQRILSDGTIQSTFNGDNGIYNGWINGEKATWE